MGLNDFWKDDFHPLAHAGRVILKELREDESAPDGDLYRRIAGSAEGSHRFFAESGSVRHEQSVPLPEYLVTEARGVKASSRMGLFANAGLAWMVVDHKLYLWPFGNESDTANGNGGRYADDICRLSIPSGRPIACVELVKPKRGQSVSHCRCRC